MQGGLLERRVLQNLHGNLSTVGWRLVVNPP